MRLIIFTLSALLAFAVAEREFNLCAREEKVCPGGVKPKTPCADGSQPKCPSGRTDTCKPKWKRCADRSEPVRQCATGKPHCPWTTKNRNHPWANRQLGIMALYNHPQRPTRCLKLPSCMLKQIDNLGSWPCTTTHNGRPDVS